MGSTKPSKSIKSQKNSFINKFTKQTPMEQDQQSFKTIRNKNGQIEIQLNNKYFIKNTHQLYDTIQFLVMLINQKNKKDQASLPEEMELKYFSSVQFILAQSKMEQEKCMICLGEFQISKFLEKQLAQASQEDIFQLKCSHRYHKGCLKNMIGDKKWAKCPICGTIFGVMQGDQPQGKITITIDQNKVCQGYPKGTIIISYNMYGGVKNGVNYPGTTRTGYLPNTPQGKQVSQLLQQAFKRKLTFTVGRSVTTGLDNQIVWNGIHHKTALTGGASHFGYPDPTYLKRVTQQLALKGINIHQLHHHKHKHK